MIKTLFNSHRMTILSILFLSVSLFMTPGPGLAFTFADFGGEWTGTGSAAGGAITGTFTLTSTTTGALSFTGDLDGVGGSGTGILDPRLLA